ncbi:MAG: hypothetical protein M1832_004846 [Thelocarpon impressellum]|nr:MAG: hypothetical protein M1832_004846 [Thelocarpon impressellum]
MPGFAGGGPPPPPPLPGGTSIKSALPARPPPAASKDRGALLTDISKGTRLKKAVTNDRSSPLVGAAASGASSAAAIPAAPAVPGMGKPPGLPSGLAPPVPGGHSRARSSSDGGSGAGPDSVVDTGGAAPAPQLGGLFAGGMPKLKKRGGGIDTGRESSYASDSETSRPAPPRPAPSFAPKVTSAPKFPVARPASEVSPSAPSFGSSGPRPRQPPPKPSIKGPPVFPVRPASAFASSTSTNSLPPRAPPPPPGASKPPPPPVALRKPPSSPGTLPSSASTPPAPPPPLPASSAPQPPARSTPLLPPSNSSPGANVSPTPSLAMQAARRAVGDRPSPNAPPPPPPPTTPPSAPGNPNHSPTSSRPSAVTFPSAPSNATSSPPSGRPLPTSRSTTQAPTRSSLDPSAYTLTNGAGSGRAPSPTKRGSPGARGRTVRIEDSRWKFQDESQLPKPRTFVGGPKHYRAGRGSSVPLDLKADG